MVIWITGLSGSGKTSLSSALFRLLKPRVPELVLLDGDTIRAVFGGDLGYREQDRVIQIKRLQKLAKVLSDQQLVVIVAALYSHPELFAWNRQNFQDYFEIYLEISLDTARRRDAKGVYALSAPLEAANVVGVDIPWHVPSSPDLVINVDNPPPPDTLARQVVAGIPRLASLLVRA